MDRDEHDDEWIAMSMMAKLLQTKTQCGSAKSFERHAYVQGRGCEGCPGHACDCYSEDSPLITQCFPHTSSDANVSSVIFESSP